MDQKTPETDITIRDLYPDLSDEELLIAERNLERYAELVLRVYERLWGDAPLTESGKDHRIAPPAPPESPAEPS
ncbi:MAG TPA: hypothetical protein VI306_09885 [Pyrinomonadaceae bacterium]